MIGNGRHIGPIDNPYDTGVVEVESTSGPPLLYNEEGNFCGYGDNIGR